MDYNLLFQILITMSGVTGLISALGPTWDEATKKRNRLGKILIYTTSFFLIIATATKILEYYNDKEKETENVTRLENLSNKTQKLADSLKELVSIVSETKDSLMIINNKSDNTLKSLEKTSTDLLNIKNSNIIINNNLLTSIGKQNSLLSEQEWIQYQVLRLAYPLEPITIYYVVEYSFERPALGNYADTLETKLIKEFNQKRKYYQFLTDLTKEGNINLTKNFPTYLPGKSENELYLRQILLSNEVNLHITQNNNLEIFFPASLNSKLELLTVPIDNVSIEVFVNYSSRKFIKYIKYKRPLRTGNDNLAISSIDLIGRTITWDFSTILTANLAKIGFQFKYDYDTENFYRYITTSNTTNNIISNSAIIKSEDIGINDILKSINKSQNSEK